ncbi:phosphatase PAP2 family protein [Cohnella pontilimi]|uniref:Phosphatase PAP2 family protein n=1 Tax=Cohnella pontilimi TaxID=2564100 RepID=A0A4V5LS57_9BACL|nr:bifunctional DedA family/phosphatase PAP2 family protein [Cohnella pontilimi]TJY41719.1 phosphatase PAP2 family protein [Cohnella pontilimi]
MSFFTHMLEQYGYGVLFLALMLELIAVPLPGEFIMTYAGLIVYQGQLNWLLSIVAAGSGACIGKTVSYWIGYRLGQPFFEKYGSRIHFGPDKLDNVSHWYQRYGNKLLLIAFFIPGVRHITGIFSGVTGLPFRKYAVYAYTGAVIWVSIFISLGRLLGPKWEKYHHTVNRYMIIIGVLSALIYLCVYVFRKKKDKLRVLMVRALNIALLRYNSMRRVRFIIFIAFAFFVIFASLLIGLIQDFLAHEFVLFDEVAAYIVHQIIGPNESESMNRAALLGSNAIIVPVLLLTGLWIAFKGKDRRLEWSIFVWAAVGGEGLSQALRYVFHRPGPAGSSSVFTFPSEQAMLSFAIYGFAAYLALRHGGKFPIRAGVVIVVFAVCLIVGISQVYLGVEYPSDVSAGYVFGGIWLTMNVILLEVLRAARHVTTE